MFTGIVEAIGEVVWLKEGSVEVATPFMGLSAGESVAVDGVCLTVTSPAQGRFIADLSEETVSRTTLGSLKEGDKVNLERPMAADGRFGGHLVQGHVDGIGVVEAIEDLPGSRTVWVRPHDMRYIAEKGSVTIDGISLTVASVADRSFSVALIPHTIEVTTAGLLAEGISVNIEFDIIAKYVERLLPLSEQGEEP